MNAAARLLQHSSLSRHWVISVVFAKAQALTMTLVAAVLISSLSMIYVTNTSRNVHAAIQQTLIERNQLHIHWGQLLLEKSTLTMQARVERVAQEQMGMVQPDHQSVVIVNE